MFESPQLSKQSILGATEFDLSSWRLEQELKHSSELSAVKPNPVWVIKNSRDGRFIATGGHDGSVKIWTVASDPLNSKTKTFIRQRSATAEDLKFPRKKNTKYEHGQCIFDPFPLHQYYGHVGAVTDLSWSFSHYFLLSASLDQTVRLWNISNTQCLCVFYHADIVSSVKFHPIEHHIFLSGAFDGRIRLWSILEKKVMHWNQVPNNSITAVEITPDGNIAMAGTIKGDILFYELPVLKYDTEITITPSFRALRLGHSRTQYKINGIESFYDHATKEIMMMINSTDSKIRIYQLRDKSLYKSFKGHICQTSLFRPNISENGRILLSPSEDKSICFWKDTEETLDFSLSSSQTSKQATMMDRLTVDEQVLCAQFASSKIYYWKNSFNNPFTTERAVQGDMDEPLVLIVSDVAGRICIYKNEASSAALTVRSFKDISISPQTLMQIRKTSSPNLMQKPAVGKTTSNPREVLLPEINIIPSEEDPSIISVEPRKQTSSSYLLNFHSQSSRFSAPISSQLEKKADLKKDLDANNFS